jgi:hypothetical protein
MHDVTRSPDLSSAPRSGVTTSTLLRRWVLPSFALAALASGLALLAEPVVTVGTTLPYAMFVAGLAVLVASVSLTRTSEPSALAPSPKVDPPRPTPDRARRVVPPPLTGTREPVPPREAGSDWRVPSSPVLPSDETWLSWLPPEHRWPAPEERHRSAGVVRSPGIAGNLVAFPVRGYYDGFHSPNSGRRDGRVPTRDGSSRLSSPGPGGPPSTASLAERSYVRSLDDSPFTEDDLDRLFPPTISGRTIILAEAPLKVGRPNGTSGELRPRWEHSVEDRGEPSGHPKETLLADVEAESDIVRSLPSSSPEHTERSLGAPPHPTPLGCVLDEVANPLPPHLRASGSSAELGLRTDAAPPHRKGRTPRSVCASCSKVVLDLRMSGPCPKCLRPICNECLREALATRGRGWCVDCTGETPTVPQAAS